MIENKDDQPTAEDLWKAHIETGEPLTEDEVLMVVEAGVTTLDEWDDRGGGLFWHAATWPDLDQG